MANLNKLYQDKDWHKFKNKPFIPLGYLVDKPETNQLIVLESSLFNILVSGHEQTRSNFLHCAMHTLLETSKKENLKFIILGRKKSKLAVYKKLSNLLFPLETEVDYKKDAIKWCLAEMHRRFQLAYQSKKSFDEYNQNLKEKMPRIVIVIEELDELMREDKKFYKQAFEAINMFSVFTYMHFIVGISHPANTKLMPEKMTKNFFYRIVFDTGRPADLKIAVREKGIKRLNNQDEFYYTYGQTKESPTHLKSFHISQREITRQIQKQL